jgi:hypothetical protein
MKKNIFYVGVIALFLAACGGIKTTPINGMPLTLDLPSGWSMDTATYERYTIEISKKGMRAAKITEPEVVAESLDQLVAGAKDFEILSKETTPNGFGITLKADGIKQFIYYVNKGGKQYKFEPGPYYEEKCFDEAVQIAKSLK